MDSSEKIKKPRKKQVLYNRKYDKDFYPEDFIRQSSKGRVLAQIAADWKVSRNTLYEWKEKHPEMGDAMKKGKELAETWYINLGQSAVIGKARDADGKDLKVSLGWFVWMSKNLFKWSDRADHQISTPEGQSIVTESKQTLSLDAKLMNDPDIKQALLLIAEKTNALNKPE